MTILKRFIYTSKIRECDVMKTYQATVESSLGEVFVMMVSAETGVGAIEYAMGLVQRDQWYVNAVTYKLKQLERIT